MFYSGEFVVKIKKKRYFIDCWVERDGTSVDGKVNECYLLTDDELEIPVDPDYDLECDLLEAAFDQAYRNEI